MSTSGIVLAGGRSRRMGRDKASLQIDGRTLLHNTIETLQAVADEVFVVGRERGPCNSCVHYLADEIPDTGPLGGLYTGLRAGSHTHAIVVSCDLPFLNARVLRFLLDHIGSHDAVIPRVDGMDQPLHAVYARSVLPAIEKRLASGSYGMKGLLSEIDVHVVTSDDMGDALWDARSFVNVNTRKDWEAVTR